MNFCPKCGRQRTDSNRFCGGCGIDFGKSAADSGTPLAHETAPAEQARWGGDSWLAKPSPADGATSPSDEPADRWESPDTISATPYATPPQSTGYLTPAQPPTKPAGPRRRSGGGRTTAFIVVGVVVALAAGGGVYALVSQTHGHATAQPSHPATVNASTAAPAVQVSTSLAASASASPSASPSASATPSPTQTGTVQVAPGVANDPAEPQVDAYLNRYFNAINTRNYSEYDSLLDAEQQQANTQSSFDSGYATTKDSDEVLTGITDTGGGTLTANVSFTSHQSPADSIDQSACNNWRLSLYLVPQGNGYVMTAAPASYHAAYTEC